MNPTGRNAVSGILPLIVIAFFGILVGLLDAVVGDLGIAAVVAIAISLAVTPLLTRSTSGRPS